jgi:CMP-N,N'-diacetyllegionaminic acid synthase
VIPARGGSRGIRKKNLAVVGGRPLIAWTVAAASEASAVDRIVVSTDSDEIAAVAPPYSGRRP